MKQFHKNGIFFDLGLAIAIGGLVLFGVGMVAEYYL